jgi:hypothetical protein
MEIPILTEADITALKSASRVSVPMLKFLGYSKESGKFYVQAGDKVIEANDHLGVLEKAIAQK